MCVDRYSGRGHWTKCDQCVFAAVGRMCSRSTAHTRDQKRRKTSSCLEGGKKRKQHSPEPYSSARPWEGSDSAWVPGWERMTTQPCGGTTPSAEQRTDGGSPSTAQWRVRCQEISSTRQNATWKRGPESVSLKQGLGRCRLRKGKGVGGREMGWEGRGSANLASVSWEEGRWPRTDTWMHTPEMTQVRSWYPWRDACFQEKYRPALRLL